MTSSGALDSFLLSPRARNNQRLREVLQDNDVCSMRVAVEGKKNHNADRPSKRRKEKAHKNRNNDDRKESYDTTNKENVEPRHPLGRRGQGTSGRRRWTRDVENPNSSNQQVTMQQRQQVLVSPSQGELMNIDNEESCNDDEVSCLSDPTLLAARELQNWTLGLGDDETQGIQPNFVQPSDGSMQLQDIDNDTFVSCNNDWDPFDSIDMNSSITSNAFAIISQSTISYQHSQQSNTATSL